MRVKNPQPQRIIDFPQPTYAILVLVKVIHIYVNPKIINPEGTQISFKEIKYKKLVMRPRRLLPKGTTCVLITDYK